MADLFADALDSKIESHYKHKKIDRYDHDLLGHYLDVEMAPTIDAEPVRRGVWVPIDDEPHEDFECSACGYVSTAAFDCGGITPNAFPYCPMCGAKMDGDCVPDGLSVAAQESLSESGREMPKCEVTNNG